MIKKDPTTSIRSTLMNWKSTRKLWGQQLNKIQPQTLTPWLRYMGRFRKQNKCKFHPNIGSLNNTIEEERNKMCEKFISNPCKSFRRYVNTIIEKNVVILNKFTVLCLTSYSVYFLILKSILFYYRVIYYYTRIFLILLPHPVWWNKYLLSRLVS